ncbi:hypothetical protein Tco_0654485 [Tanacetum coccineum]|uniref:Uncharacterized protein n=1 Tax=Tanacetum coccineum TaxID=301880 RepID=A0ABQ4X4A9_9ASTR
MYDCGDSRVACDVVIMNGDKKCGDDAVRRRGGWCGGGSREKGAGEMAALGDVLIVGVMFFSVAGVVQRRMPMVAGNDEGDGDRI